MCSAVGMALRASGLRKTFGGVVAVDGVSLELGRGECLALLGPNGAGKTTTMEILEGIQAPDAGTIEIFGVTHGVRNKGNLERMGVVLQETNLYKRFTVRETLSLFASFYERPLKVDDVLAKLHLQDKANAKLMELSGGQKQRVYIGCGLVNNPEILFVDEPTAALDPQARRLIWELLREIRDDGRSLLLTTHYMEEAEKLADRVAIIDHGRIIAEDTPQELIRKHVGGHLLRLRVAQNDGHEAAIRQLTTDLEWLSEAIYDNGTLSARAPEDISQWQSLMQATARSGAVIEDLQIRQSSLEDVFLTLTGRTIRDA